MKKFHLTIGPRNAPRLAFECMAVDAFAARDQHDSLRMDGERIEIEPHDQRQQDRAALLCQVDRPSELTLACSGGLIHG